MRYVSILILTVAFSYGQNLEVSFMRFYASDHDYMADIRLLATNRFEQPHIQVFYNDRKVPVLKEWINIEGESIKQEFLEYGNDNKSVSYTHLTLPTKA